MKELIDFKPAWEWLTTRWARSFGWVLLVVLAFWFGTVWEAKTITEDCRFVGAFRDGAQAYTCSPRVR